MPVDFGNGRLYNSCMRYFTEEYFKLFVHHMNVRRVADKKYSNKEIETLKKRQLNRLIRKAEIAHDIPPTKLYINTRRAQTG